MAQGSIHTEPMDGRTRGRARWNDYSGEMDGAPDHGGDLWDRYTVADYIEPPTLADSIDRAHRAAAAGHAARGETLPGFLVTYGADVDADAVAA